MTSEPVGPEPTPLTSAQQEELLSTGELSIVGRVIDSSNGTYVVEVTDGDTYTWAIYKPQSGERPLWDFDPGLYKRERAAYVLSEALGWSLVPPTMVRADAPLGVGSLQWYIECDPSMHYFNLLRHAPHTHDALRRMAVFDMVGNNTDRKGGHVLQSADGHVWGIDHGLCFAAEYKLRTVIWDFAGEAVPDDVLDDLAPLADEVPAELADLLDVREVRALRRRVQRLLDSRMLPLDTTGYAYPWPLI